MSERNFASERGARVDVGLCQIGKYLNKRPPRALGSFEHGTKTMENLLGVKSLDKAIEVQTEYAKTAYEGYVNPRDEVETHVGKLPLNWRM
jgi:hypothetical protein